MEVYIVITENYDTHEADVITHSSTDVNVFNDAFEAALKVADNDQKKAKDFYTEINKLKTGQTKMLREYITKSLTEKYEISVTKKSLSLSNKEMLSFKISGCDLMGSFDPESHMDQIEESDEEENEESDEEEEEEEEEADEEDQNAD